MRTVAAGVVLLLAAVAGCSSSDAEPAEVGPLASASAAPLEAPRSSPSTPVSSPSASTAATPTRVPLAAQPETAQGATAFTRYFFEVANQAYVNGETTPLLGLSHPDCNSCKSIVSDIDRLFAASLRVDGSRFRMDYVETAPLEPDRVIVDFRFDADAYVERRLDGGVEREVPQREDVVGQARLTRGTQGWLMYGLQLVEA